MTSNEFPTRLAWQDRFNTPTIESLREDLPAAAQEMFKGLRDGMQNFDVFSEQLVWHGDSWCWSVEYRLRDSDVPFAAIIPSPEDLQFAMPLDKEFAKLPALARLKRTVRDGLDLAREPYDTSWAIWSLQFPGLVDDLLDVVKRHLKYQSAKAG